MSPSVQKLNDFNNYGYVHASEKGEEKKLDQSDWLDAHEFGNIKSDFLSSCQSLIGS